MLRIQRQCQHVDKAWHMTYIVTETFKKQTAKQHILPTSDTGTYIHCLSAEINYININVFLS